jgi:glycogen debranching enzyme
MKLPAATQRALQNACEAILSGYARGTRFGIRMDSDGLLAAGIAGVQLTWMDAKIGDWVVTPRIGKPIEVQALWLNALRIVGEWSPGWMDHHARASAAVRARFWREDARCLHDVADVDHVAGRMDPTFRPNQIFAVGGLPFPLFEGEQARAIVDFVESRLLTPLGLRSLASDDPAYRARYEGGVTERDSAYHQGTIWPWLMGPFVEAWLRVRDFAPAGKNEAKRRFLESMQKHLATGGLGHISEIADAESPFTPRGCPFQAWSLGEFLRIQMLLETPKNVGIYSRGTRSRSSVRRIARGSARENQDSLTHL